MDKTQEATPIQPPAVSDPVLQADRLEQKGALAFKLACYAQARHYYEQALALREPIQGTHPAVALTLQHLGEIAAALREDAPAAIAFGRAFRISEQTQGRNHPQSLHLLGKVAMTLCAQGQTGQAQSLLQEVLVRAEQALGPSHLETAHAACNLASFWHLQRDYEQAEPLFQRAVAIAEQLTQHNPLVLAPILHQFGILYLDWKRLDAAEPLLLRAMMLWRRSVPSDHPLLATSFQEIGRLARLRGKQVQALSLTEHALHIVQAKLPATHPQRIALEHACQSLRAQVHLPPQEHRPGSGTRPSGKGLSPS